MLPPFSPHTEVGRNTSARADASAVNAPTAITNGTASSRRAMRMRSGKSCSGVGAEQHQRADLAGGGGVEDAGWRRAPRRCTVAARRRA